MRLSRKGKKLLPVFLIMVTLWLTTAPVVWANNNPHDLNQSNCQEFATAYGQAIALNDLGYITGQFTSLIGIGLQGIGVSVVWQANSRAWQIAGSAISGAGIATTIAGDRVTISFENERQAMRVVGGAIVQACAAANLI